MKSRSPSPFTSSSRPSSHAPRMFSPLNEPASFATRDVQIALATSTSSTMQPNGPLAQLARTSSEAPPPSTEDWRAAPSAPWASPPPIPSDVEPPPAPAQPQNHQSTQSSLGSPFIYRTWGPSRSRDTHRPRPFSDDAAASASIPRLRSPIQLHSTFPANHKRRAQFPLEDELSPGGSGHGRRGDIDDVFGPEPGAGRRVRTRGFTLGAAFTNAGGPRSDFGNPRTVSGATMTAGAAGPGSGNDDARMQEARRQDSLRQLGSPFAGIRSRPSRARGRHLVTASLGSIQPGAEFTSIDALLHQAEHGNNGMDMR